MRRAGLCARQSTLKFSDTFEYGKDERAMSRYVE
jgi:hypothetical protein